MLRSGLGKSSAGHKAGVARVGGERFFGKSGAENGVSWEGENEKEGETEEGAHSTFHKFHTDCALNGPSNAIFFLRSVRNF